MIKIYFTEKSSKIKNTILEILSLIKLHGRTLWLMFFIFLILSFVEVLGISLIGPYLSLIFTDNSSFLVDFSQFTSGYFKNDNEALIFLGCVLIVIFIAKAITAFYVNFQIIKFSRELHLDMHTSLLKDI